MTSKSPHLITKSSCFVEQEHFAREEAIKYIDSVYNKGQLFKNAVDNSAFGANYAQTINSMDADSINSALNELKNLIDSYDTSKMTQAEKDALLHGIDSSVNLSLGESKSIQLPRSGSCNGNIITTDRISYQASSPIAVDNATGKVTFNSSVPGTYSGIIAVLIDGQKVASKTVNVVIEKTIAGLAGTIGYDSWGGNSEHLEVYGLPGVGDGNTQVTSQSFADLYNNNAVIMLHRKNNNDTYTSLVQERLTNLCGFIVNALASKGLESTKLQSCANHVISILMSNFSRKGKSDDDTEGTALGTRVSNKIKAGEFDGVVKFTDFKRKDYQVNMVSFKEVVDLILKEYGY